MIKSIIFALAFIILGPVIGGILTGITKKASARTQGRKGSSIFQPLSDTIMLLQKNQNEDNKIQSYYIKVSLLFNIVAGVLFFGGYDMLITVACLGLSAIFIVLSAYSSGSYYARIGADIRIRELVAEAPMMFIVAIGFYAYTGSFNVRDIVTTDPVALLPLVGLFIGFVLIPCNRLRRSNFEFIMPHEMYQKDMNSISDEFNKRDSALSEISSWYEKVVIYGFMLIFFTNGSLLMILIGIIVCLVMAIVQGILENAVPKYDGHRAFKMSWLAALILGAINLLIVYILF